MSFWIARTQTGRPGLGLTPRSTPPTRALTISLKFLKLTFPMSLSNLLSAKSWSGPPVNSANSLHLAVANVILRRCVKIRPAPGRTINLLLLKPYPLLVLVGVMCSRIALICVISLPGSNGPITQLLVFTCKLSRTLPLDDSVASTTTGIPDLLWTPA